MLRYIMLNVEHLAIKNGEKTSFENIKEVFSDVIIK